MLHPTLVPLVFVQTLYPPYLIPIHLSPPLFFTCCQHVFIMFRSEKEGINVQCTCMNDNLQYTNMTGSNTIRELIKGVLIFENLLF